MVHGRKRKQAVKAKIELVKCLHCECAAKQGRRGLCQAHYDIFIDERAKRKTQRDKDRFDDEQVDLGNILKARPGKRSKTSNPFKSESKTA